MHGRDQKHQAKDLSRSPCVVLFILRGHTITTPSFYSIVFFFKVVKELKSILKLRRVYANLFKICIVTVKTTKKFCRGSRTCLHLQIFPSHPRVCNIEVTVKHPVS